jgi:hypothetical protein
VSVTPFFASSSPDRAEIAMPTLLMDSLRFCAVTTISPTDGAGAADGGWVSSAKAGAVSESILREAGTARQSCRSSFFSFLFLRRIIFFCIFLLKFISADEIHRKTVPIFQCHELYLKIRTRTPLRKHSIFALPYHFTALFRAVPAYVRSQYS